MWWWFKVLRRNRSGELFWQAHLTYLFGLISIIVTPVTLSPWSTVWNIGAGPRHRGRWLGWTFSTPLNWNILKLEKEQYLKLNLYVNGCATFTTLTLLYELTPQTFWSVTCLNTHLKENLHYITFSFSANTEREMRGIKVNTRCWTFA